MKTIAIGAVLAALTLAACTPRESHTPINAATVEREPQRYDDGEAK